MPKVTLIYADGVERTTSGGCFGFAGKRGNFNSSLVASGEIETFRYDFGNHWGTTVKMEGLRDPRPVLEWMKDHSMWAKYIKGINDTTQNNLCRDNQLTIDITTDAQGHAVIGTASATRLLMSHRDSLLPLMNLALQADIDLGILWLVWYSLFKRTNCGTSYNNKLKIIPGNGITTSQGQIDFLSIGDNEVMKLDHIAPYDIYSIVAGTFEYSDIGEANYRTSRRYSLEILNSFETPIPSGTKYRSFGKYLQDRFLFPLVAPDYSKVTTGMGSSSTPTVNHHNSVNPMMLLGFAAQLTQEFRETGEFKGYF